MYVRQENEGTDYWNRVLSSHGGCKSENAVAYLTPLALLNLSVVIVAGWLAYRARGITSEFSESKYIGLAVFSLFQAFLTGLPVSVVVREQPQAFYLILTSMIFLLCTVVLSLIFLPKIFKQREYNGMSNEEQRRVIAENVKISSGMQPSSHAMHDRSSAIEHVSAYMHSGFVNSGVSVASKNDESRTDNAGTSDDTSRKDTQSHSHSSGSSNSIEHKVVLLKQENKEMAARIAELERKLQEQAELRTAPGGSDNASESVQD